MESWHILLTRFIVRWQEDIINHKMLPWTIKALLSGSVALTVNALRRTIQKVMGELSFLLKWKTEISLHLPVHFSSLGDPHPEVEKITDTWMTLSSCSGFNGHTSVGMNKETQSWNWNIRGCFLHWCPEEPDDCWVCSVLSGVLSNRAKDHDVMLLRTTELSAPKQKVLFLDRNASTPKAEHLDLASPKVN